MHARRYPSNCGDPLLSLCVCLLRQVWSCEALREQFLALPYPAVRCLLDSGSTAVATENTVLVALTGWVEEGPHGRSTTSAQRKELLSLVSQWLVLSARGESVWGLCVCGWVGPWTEAANLCASVLRLHEVCACLSLT